MTRRRDILGLGSALMVMPTAVAGQSARGQRLCWLGSIDSFREPYSVAMIKRLAELGFAEGSALTVDRRHADGRVERLPELATEMTKQKCDAMFGGGPEAVLAALTQVSRETPIIYVAVDFDPVATGDVASLARPGGRVTGITAQQSVLPAKRVELLKEMLPNAARIAVLANDQTSAQLSQTQGTARRLGLSLQVIDLKRPPFNLEAAFAEAVRAKADAMFVLGSALWVPHRKAIPEAALKAKLPTMFHQAQWTEAGGLMSYGFDFPSMYRRAAEMLAAVLKGGKPATMPMEQPTTYELAINLKTAKALGITIPQPLLMRADRVFQ